MNKGTITKKHVSDFSLVESFPLETVQETTQSSTGLTGLWIYELPRKGEKPSRLILSGSLSDDLISYISQSSPELYKALKKRIQKTSLYFDLANNMAYNHNGPDDQPDTTTLLEALRTISIFSKRFIDCKASTDIVSVILCGGKGSRMRSKDRHKVCFPIAGRPAINRTLDILESAGIHEHIVVVGEMGEQVVQDVTEVRDGVTFVYQFHQNGTGNAAKQAAYLLHSQKFNGAVLVILGDKVVEKSSILRLLKSFKDSQSDAALMVAEKKLWPDAGRIVFDPEGKLVGIIEKSDIIKMILSRKLLDMKRKKSKISSRELLAEIFKEIPSRSKARTMFGTLIDRLEDDGPIALTELKKLIPEENTTYPIRKGTKGKEIIRIPGEELERTISLINVSLYLFRAEVFYHTVFRIKTDNAQKEEYFPDVIRLINEDTKKTWKIIPVPVRDQFEVMSFNNPEDLLKIEDYYNKKESRVALTTERPFERMNPKLRKRALRPAGEWLRIFDEFGTNVKKSFRAIYGDNQDVIAERRKVYHKALIKFIKVYGTNTAVIIARSPGRINLMGRHIDHRGGFNNHMAINREVILVAGARDDDIVEIHNVDSHRFRPRSFSIGGELSSLPWDEWLNMINSDTVRKMIHQSRGDWSNYFRAAALRLQQKFKGRMLYGLKGVVSGTIPVGVGLSSSSAVVVSAAEALVSINGLDIIPNEFVDLCGEGEWFVGAQSESGDHAAMKLAEKGNIIHVGYHNFRIENVLPFPEEYSLFILESLQHREKSGKAMQVFNEKLATYEIAHEIVKSRFPSLAGNMTYFRDINADNLGLKPFEIYDILLAIPEKITRKEVMKILDDRARKRLERIFATHREPAGGYEPRTLALFGLAEIERSHKFVTLIKSNDVEEIGHLMKVSHNGDRVTMPNESGERIKYDNSVPDSLIRSLRERLALGNPSASLHLQPGGYGCSTPVIDEIVDLTVSINGVAGAQLSGAGLGGCVMALVHNEAAENFQKTMTELYYEKHGLPAQPEICVPIDGSGIFSL